MQVGILPGRTSIKYSVPHTLTRTHACGWRTLSSGAVQCTGAARVAIAAQALPRVSLAASDACDGATVTVPLSVCLAASETEGWSQQALQS